MREREVCLPHDSNRVNEIRFCHSTGSLNVREREPINVSCQDSLTANFTIYHRFCPKTTLDTLKVDGVYTLHGGQLIETMKCTLIRVHNCIKWNLRWCSKIFCSASHSRSVRYTNLLLLFFSFFSRYFTSTTSSALSYTWANQLELIWRIGRSLSESTKSHKHCCPNCTYTGGERVDREIFLLFPPTNS